MFVQDRKANCGGDITRDDRIHVAAIQSIYQLTALSVHLYSVLPHQGCIRTLDDGCFWVESTLLVSYPSRAHVH